VKLHDIIAPVSVVVVAEEVRDVGIRRIKLVEGLECDRPTKGLEHADIFGHPVDHGRIGIAIAVEVSEGELPGTHAGRNLRVEFESALVVTVGDNGSDPVI